MKWKNNNYLLKIYLQIGNTHLCYLLQNKKVKWPIHNYIKNGDHIVLQKVKEVKCIINNQFSLNMILLSVNKIINNNRYQKLIKNNFIKLKYLNICKILIGKKHMDKWKHKAALRIGQWILVMNIINNYILDHELIFFNNCQIN